MKITSFKLLALALFAYIPFVHSLSFESMGDEYDLTSRNSKLTTNQIEEDSIYPGDKVKSRKYKKEGTVGDVILLHSKEEQDALSFSESNMTVIHMAKGYWLLKFPEGTNLLEKLEWIRQQPNVISAHIEVIMNLNIPQ